MANAARIAVRDGRVRRTAVTLGLRGLAMSELIGAFTALENVLMPLMVAHGKPDRDALDRARGLLADVGLEKLADRKPDQLSGGQ